MIKFCFSELPTRLQEKIYIEPNSGCWFWLGALHKDGYAHIHSGKNRKALGHRLIYKFFGGPLAQDLEADHLCKTRCCVNPMHLEFVPHKTNILRGESPSAKHARKTSCAHGHPLAGENLMIGSRGQRICRICHLASARKHQAKRRELGLKRGDRVLWRKRSIS
jgi:hypothetical protein